MDSSQHKQRAAKVNMGPGSLVHIGKRKEGAVNIRVMDYSLEHLEEFVLKDIQQCSNFKNKDSVTWFDIDGIHDTKIIEHIGQTFNVHVLALEDVMNSTGRPKVESFDDYTLVSLKMLEYQSDNKSVHVEHFSILYGHGFLFSFQEIPEDNFEPIRERIRSSLGRVRGKDSEYLAYLLLDTIVDNYILVSQQFAERIEELEEQIVRNVRESTLSQILNLRKELLNFKQSIDPLREAINTLYRQSSADNQKYFRDVYDHIVFESENISMYRELIVNLLELHQNMLSVKTNEVMKVLTIITTIFVPLTFIVGVYGMNFDNMPELRWQNGYYYVLGLMGLCVVGMLIFFKRQRWI